MAIASFQAMALDLTPRLSASDLEGVNVPIVELNDGRVKVIFQPPGGWQLSGGKTQLNFVPPGADEIVVQLQIHGATPADANGPDDLEKWCRQFLPATRTQVAVTGDAVSPFTLRGLPSREYTYSYAFQARRFITSVAVVDLSPEQRLSLVVTAYPENFKANHEAAMRCMFTFDWQSPPAAKR